MSLTVLDDLEQGSDAWHAQRRGIVTASVIGQLITAKTIRTANNDYSRGLTAQLVAERITGYTEPTYVTDEMLRGHEDEPRAIDVYSEHFGVPVRTIGMMIREESGWRLGYSPDGLVGDDGLIEVKSRRQKKQLLTVLDDAVPSENMAQVQCGLFVSGRDWLDFLSYSGGMRMYVRRIYPDPRWFDAIQATVEQFERNAAEMAARYYDVTADMPMTERTPDYQEIVL